MDTKDKLKERIDTAMMVCAVTLVMWFSFLLMGCASLQKYAPNTFKAVEKSGATLDNVGATVISKGEKDLADKIEKVVE